MIFWANLIISISVLAAIVSLVALRRSPRPLTAHAALAVMRTVVGGFISINGLAILLMLGLAVFMLSTPMPVLAQGGATPATDSSGSALGAALATGLACIGAGIAVGIAGAAAIGGITEKPEILGRTLIFVGLAEGIAIYGLIISFMILNR